MPRIRIAGQIGAELSGAFERSGVEAEFDGIVLLVSKVKDRWPLRNRRKQCVQVGNRTVVKIRRCSPDAIVGPRLVLQRGAQFVRPVAVPRGLLTSQDFESALARDAAATG
jgi:hypothetical protein